MPSFWRFAYAICFALYSLGPNNRLDSYTSS